MWLTDAERRVAAAQAARFPAGRGAYFLALPYHDEHRHQTLTTAAGAAYILEQRPDYLAFG